MIRIVFTLILSLALYQLSSQSLSFYRESLNFELNDSCFYVSGMYFFKNLSDKEIKIPIIYPYIYPTDSISDFAVYNCNTMNYIEARENAKSHSFEITVPATGSTVLHIKYRQKHNRQKVTYILMTTHAWNKPFEEADYTLRVNEKVMVKQLFYNADTTWFKENYLYYYWHRKNYMPTTNFDIIFEVEQ